MKTNQLATIYAELAENIYGSVISTELLEKNKLELGVCAVQATIADNYIWENIAVSQAATTANIPEKDVRIYMYTHRDTILEAVNQLNAAKNK